MLEEGAKTIVEQCLKLREGERVVVVNDGNDPELVEALVSKVSERTDDHELVEYDELEEHGEEPPERVAEKLKSADVFIAPTNKSLSHTDARRDANENGARGATLPNINREIWNSSLQADYRRVEKLSEKVYSLLEDADTVHIETPSGTDLKIDVDIEYYETDTGLIHEPGEFGNLPAGEADGAALNARGKLVVDHFPILPEAQGTEIGIEDNQVVSIEGFEEFEETLFSTEGGCNVAEFGFGTNEEATLIGKLLQDEKVFGTVHVAFGDNSSYVPEGDENRVNCPLHWDVICRKPTVRFDEKLILEQGKPILLGDL